MAIRIAGPTLRTMDTRTAASYRPAKIADPFYMTPEWTRLRDQVRAEAGGICQRPGCSNPGREVDHIVERKDGGSNDRSNLEFLCVSCHRVKTVKAAKERDLPAANHPEWLLPSAIPLTIVCGPPASGKTTWAKRQGADILIDLDQIMVEVSGLPMYQADRQWLNLAIRQRNKIIAQLAARRRSRQRAILIVGEPTAQRREWWARKLKPTSVVVMETPKDVCLERIASDPRRAARREEMSQAVSMWWHQYAKRAADVVIPYVDISQQRDSQTSSILASA